MKALFIALYNLFKLDTSGAFYVAVAGRLYFARAPHGTSFPYAVISLERNEPIYSSQTHIEDVKCTVFLFASTLTNLMDLSTSAKALFDDCDLTVTGYQFIQFERESEGLIETEDDEFFCYGITYNCLIEKEF